MQGKRGFSRVSRCQAKVACCEDFEEFSEGAKTIILAALTIAAEAGKADSAKPLHGFGSGVLEIALVKDRLKRLKEALR